MDKKLSVGWREWVSLPWLGLPAIKAKIDTGARTSSLHAVKIKPFKEKGQKFVRFSIHPLQRRKTIIKQCVAPVVDRRFIKDSGGHRELRYVIKTPVKIGSIEREIEISITNRGKMDFRMLIGRTAMENLIVIPHESFLTGRMKKKDVVQMYREENKEQLS